MFARFFGFKGRAVQWEGWIRDWDHRGHPSYQVEFYRTRGPAVDRSPGTPMECELGAFAAMTLLLTERSPSISDNRVERLERVILAATKQMCSTV
ncbi:hypothetical protein MLD38_023279 [Melastoma candidum]|uniref:Uncharacterized protein n=1 Tax=Melastoma candidum TaxID=119954 RepID=A0ACB9QMJ2_9MYRT|nr:hypothetical protein MLD38_023279 [Melastoma candidum]